MWNTMPSHCRAFNYVLSQYQQTCDAVSKVKLTKTCIMKKIPRGRETAYESVGEKGAGKMLNDSFCYRGQSRKSNLEEKGIELSQNEFWLFFNWNIFTDITESTHLIFLPHKVRKERDYPGRFTGLRTVNEKFCPHTQCHTFCSAQ